MTKTIEEAAKEYYLNEVVNGEEWTQTCDFYPHCSDCPDFTPKKEKQ